MRHLRAATADAQERARQLARSLLSLSDPHLRVRSLRHAMGGMEAGELADLMTIAALGTEARDPAQGALFLTLCVALADEPDLRRAVTLAATERGQHHTAALLWPRSTPEPTEEARLPEVDGRVLTLGERKALARRRDPDRLARALRDPHPDVVRILLGNPALTEDDVARLCARRPVAPAVVREVFRNLRWIVRYRVRRVIVMNPSSPLDIALQLGLHLSGPDAREAAAATDLDPMLRELCMRVAAPKAHSV